MTYLLIKYGNIALTTTTIHRVWYHLCLLLLVRMGGYIVNLSDFYSSKAHRETDRFFSASGVQLAQTDRDQFHFRHEAFSSQLKSKVDLTLGKTVDLRITLNLDRDPIISKSHTHPSHSETSRLLTSSLSIFRYSSSSSHPVYVRHVDSSSLGYSLSSHRQSYIGLVITSRFID